MTSNGRLILASGSRIRREILSRAGLKFVVRPANVDEQALKTELRRTAVSPETGALALAYAKASEVARQEMGPLVIGADQLLVCNGIWFDKPVSMSAAREQLKILRGNEHQLITAVTVHQGSQRRWHHVDRAQLQMRPFSDDFLDRYLKIAGDDVLSSVGAYQLEGIGAQLFSRIDGDYFTILGLQLLSLLAFLRDVGFIDT